MKRIVFVTIASILCFIACVERGKPIEKEETVASTKSDKKKVDHYTCPKGHKGADKKGTCSECSSVLVHNAAFHGNSLTIPTPTLKDPFSAGSTAPGNNKTSPAQNAYGDFHYTCPNGHSGGAGSATNCTTCDTKLVHNQLYHK